jgi:hypothetical protein
MVGQHFTKGRFAGANIAGDGYVFNPGFVGWQAWVHNWLIDLCVGKAVKYSDRMFLRDEGSRSAKVADETRPIFTNIPYGFIQRLTSSG